MISNIVLRQIKNLPPLPKSVLEVQKITADPNASIKDLVKVIQEDPMLTANLLKVANSPLYGFTRQIKTIDQAVALFGMSTVKGFVISFAIKNTIKFDLGAYGVEEARFHDVSMKRNALAINWYKKERSKLDVIATDSFLIDVGAVVISLVLASEGKTEEFKKELETENRYKVELKYVGATTGEITAEIFKHWHFSTDLIEAMAHIDIPGKTEEYFEYAASLRVLRIAVNLLKDDEEAKEKSLKLIEKYNLNKKAFLDAWEVVIEGNV